MKIKIKRHVYVKTEELHKTVNTKIVISISWQNYVRIGNEVHLVVNAVVNRHRFHNMVFC